MTNRTPFLTFGCDKMGVGRRFCDTLVVKATILLAASDPTMAERQPPIALVDEPWDSAVPELSSLKHAGEVVLIKPSTDVIVTGAARAPRGEPAQTWDTAVEVVRGSETIIASRAQVLGPRRWRHRAETGWELTDPEPTLEVPIRYELAYGGAYPAIDQAGEEADPDAPPAPKWVVHRPNPSGTGFFDERAMDPAKEYRAPQWQRRAQPITRWNQGNQEAPPSGFGPVARAWISRLKFAGSYDAAWVKKTRTDAAQGLPADYATDFDPRFFQCANPELITPAYLEGNERIVLHGLLPDPQPCVAQLPRVAVVATLVDGGGGVSEERLNLDTVCVDVDAGTVAVCWRLTLDQARDIRAATLDLRKLT